MRMCELRNEIFIIIPWQVTRSCRGAQSVNVFPTIAAAFVVFVLFGTTFNARFRSFRNDSFCASARHHFGIFARKQDFAKTVHSCHHHLHYLAESRFI